MTALAHIPHTFETRAQASVRDRRETVDRLWLWPADHGWSLVTRDGNVVFTGTGPASRRACLRRAYDLGVLAVLG